MPEISRFFGIQITMRWLEHGTPHFHAKYGEHEAAIDIETGTVLAGDIPHRVASLVEKWAALHRQELSTDWELAERHEPLQPIAPLA